MKKWIFSLLALCIAIGGGWWFVQNQHSKTSTKHQTETSKKVATSQPSKLDQAKLAYQQYNYTQAYHLLKNEKTKDSSKLKKYISNQSDKLVTWNKPDKFRHLFFHSLIVNPKKAFKSKSAKGYADYMVTVSEFDKILKQLYQNGYVLVGIQSLVTNDHGKLKMNSIKLPKGKTPLILSQDDVSYYEYMKGDGFAKDLFVDGNGKIRNHYVDDGKDQVGNYDLVPIVDQFVRDHPDFSYQGQKGTIALTGYNGVLGYRTSPSEYKNKAKRNVAIKKATKTATAMKKDGWTFASHSWGHINMTESPLAQIKRDNALWQKEVTPIIGKTDIFIDPFGADIGGVAPYNKGNQKYDYMHQQGFNIFCNVDASHTSWGQIGSNFYRNARINVDGIRIKSDLDKSDPVLKDFFNVHQVIDQRDRKSVKS
ncbi:polysaccharide deacetylase family protein [Pediococcus argentinicus]|uniref:NodB homology domain-containing protein n=1 Tax=Pediococcus argentinicus TaxID=480391 RepID=A0A0R2NHM2_9LACO|nr:hypothetical protein [Pediococcus argentinicus]KRO25313.1 hypothetical protein IV88_GL000258 [Pediococcus argentinicus]NKZ22052.1 hypothetical protein [Pediococcus argentinicus]GEP19391.1 hydrolase [Pediococcus argentinicus]